MGKYHLSKVIMNKNAAAKDSRILLFTSAVLVLNICSYKLDIFNVRKVPTPHSATSAYLQRNRPIYKVTYINQSAHKYWLAASLNLLSSLIR